MDLGLHDKVALVAASSQGLGYAVANELALEGASLVICSRNKESIERAREKIIAETAADVAAFSADVSVADDIDRVVNGGIDRFGKIDIVVTNSGGPPAGPFESTTRENWDTAVDILLHSVIHL